jgi:hypothetical protein
VKCDRDWFHGHEKFTISRQSDGSYFFKGGAGNKWCRRTGDKMGCNFDNSPHHFVTKSIRV